MLRTLTALALVLLSSAGASAQFFDDAGPRERARERRAEARERNIERDRVKRYRARCEIALYGEDLPGRTVHCGRVAPRRRIVRDVHQPVLSGYRGDGTAVYAWSSRDAVPHDRDKPRCLAPMTVEGDGALVVDNAMASAKLNWIQSTHLKHGELYSNIDAAEDVFSRCTRAGTGETAGGKVLEWSANLFKQDGFLKRCQIVARPCLVPFVPGLQAVTPSARTMRSETIPQPEDRVIKTPIGPTPR